MKRQVWLAALALGLGGVVSVGSAQQAVWRPVKRPTPAATTARGASPQEYAQATLGRPVVIGRAARGEPRQFPDAYRAGSRAGGIEPIATVPPPGSVIAASVPTQAPWTGPAGAEAHADYAAGADTFASERVTPVSKAAPALPPAVFESEKLGNWQGTFPVAPPPALTHGTAFEEVGAGAAARGGEADLPPTKWYARGEYLLWWTKADRSPPLVTTGDFLPIGQDTFVGALGRPDTRVLFGGDNLERGVYSGARFLFGYYLDDEGQTALELGGFFLSQQSTDFRTDSGTDRIITRPFFAVNGSDTRAGLPGQFTQQVSYPGLAVGSINITSPSELWGAEANLICKWCCGTNWRIDPLVGFRYLNLRESLNITEVVMLNNDRAVNFDLAGVTNTVNDRFATRNQFYGGQVGVEGRWQADRWTLDGRAKLGLGVTKHSLQIDGSQFLQFPNGTTRTDVGGLLALSSNIGGHEWDTFSVVPEVGVNVGYYLTERLRAMVGYNFLYWSSVARPGEQIDPNIDVLRVPNFFPNPADRAAVRPATVVAPAVPFRTSDYWAHGITFGLEYRY